jgi:MFS transporter, putative metabolite transport protein
LSVETSVRAPISELPHSFGLTKIVSLCAAGGFIQGYDLLIMSGALLLIVPEFHLKGIDIGFLVSAPYLAMSVGALIAGPLCDRFGRRKIYLIDVALFLIFAILQALAENVWELILMRLCIGLAVGVDMPTSSSMIAEYSPPKLRGALTSMLNTAWLVGACVALLVGYALYRTADPLAWRWMFAIAAIPAGIVAIMRHGLPETPYWARIGGEGHAPPREAKFGVVFSPKWRGPVLFFTFYWMFEAIAGGPGVVYTALIFHQVINFEGAQALLLNAAILGVCILASLLAQFTLLDRWGRKPFAMLFCALSGGGAIATGFLRHSSVPLVVAFSVFVVSSLLSIIPFWPWSTEQLPTHIRATGQAVGSAGGKIGLFMGALIFTPAFVNGIGWSHYFTFVGTIFFGLVIFVAVCGKETKATSLEL